MPSIRLGETCELGDVCQGDRADCFQGICECTREYKQLSGQCGRYCIHIHNATRYKTIIFQSAHVEFASTCTYHYIILSVNILFTALN